MQSFDYIESPDIRKSLTSDYSEMRHCMDIEAWKISQVLAGSIVECLLIDYLASQAEGAGAKDPLKIDLADAIARCRSSGAISDRTADLCAVVRSYRNLIHPGRMIRLQEKAPSRASCDIAMALIELIVEDIAKTRRSSVGLTAEQIVSKVVRDSRCLNILKHLLEDVREPQKVRLLTELFPEAYFVHADDEDDPFTSDRIASAYRVTFDLASDQLKVLAVDIFVRIVREDDEEKIDAYRRAFFRSGDLAHVNSQHRAMVKEHLLGSGGMNYDFMDLKVIEDIGPYLEPQDVGKWLSPFIRTLVSKSTTSTLKQRAREVAIGTSLTTSSEADKEIEKRLTALATSYDGRGQVDNAELVRQLQLDMLLGIPF